jgi:hypothetical protein
MRRRELCDSSWAHCTTPLFRNGPELVSLGSSPTSPSPPLSSLCTPLQYRRIEIPLFAGGPRPWNNSHLFNRRVSS